MTTYTMDDFINGNLAVRVNTTNNEKFLEMCEKKGLVWRSGCKATAHSNEEWFTCVALETYSKDEKRLVGLNKNDEIIYSDHYIFIDFSQIIDSIKYQIIIESDGDTTTAKMVVNGKEVKTATAKRNPADKANWHIGAQTAFDRLWAKQPKPEKSAEKEKDGFKIGDRVVCVGFQHDCYGKHGHIVTILNDATGLVPFGVEFDEPVCGGHDCGGVAKPGCGRWFYVRELSHEQPAKQKVREVKRQANAGEWVKIVNAANIWGEAYKNGDILQVKFAYLDGTVNLSCGGFCAFPSEYVVLEGYQP